MLLDLDFKPPIHPPLVGVLDPTNVLYGLGSIQFWAFNLLEKAKIQNSVQLPKKKHHYVDFVGLMSKTSPKNVIWYMDFVGLFFIL